MKPLLLFQPKLVLGLLIAAWFGSVIELSALEYHVTVAGNDASSGSLSEPLRTIQAAADRAMPGDTVTVHAGEYRECIVPPRGGTSKTSRITYQAAPGEKVVIKGSEIVKGWEKVQNDTWKIILPDSYFGDFNPYKEVIQGDWFYPKGRLHHLGAVYLNGHWLTETAKLEDVLAPAGENPLWFTEHTLSSQQRPANAKEGSTTIWAQLPGIEPNKNGIEIGVRLAVFYPAKTGVNYITVRGFVLEQASARWAPPTAEQVGLIGTHWSKGWIIENNTIRYSACVGVTLGKHGDEFDNTSEDSAVGYVETIRRGLARGWSKENIGHHVVRNNHISHCEQAGIVGSLGAAFSSITDNTIHDIQVRQLFGGAEMAGIKFHGAIDTTIRRNHIYRAFRGIWLDWMSQGTRVSGNLLHDNGPEQDLYIELNHGPFLIDHNISLSPKSIRDWSQGGAYVHNLFAGAIAHRAVLDRSAPYHTPHSTQIKDIVTIPGGDNRFYNNFFVSPSGLGTYNDAAHPIYAAGNAFFNGAEPSQAEQQPLLIPQDPQLTVVEKPDGFFIEMRFDGAWTDFNRPLVTSALLKNAKTPDLPFVQPDDSPYRLDTDYFDRPRRIANPFPGPFAASEAKNSTWKVWPVEASR